MKSEYGRYVKPICIFVKFEDEDSKTRVEMDECFFNIPQSLDYIVDVIKERYAAIEIDPRDPKNYKEDKIFYNKALSVIRNPRLVSELEEIEKESISLKEFTF